MKLDILVFAAHPDDAELCCSGTIASHIDQGKQVGIIELTKGELGTRGTPEIREKEAAESARILGISVRENLEMTDGFIDLSRVNILKAVKAIRKYRPEIILANAIVDRHHDHSRASEFARQAWFMSGLHKIDTLEGSKLLPSWRPRVIYHYIQSTFVKPDFIVDVSDYWDKRMESVKCFKSQFYDPNSKEPETYISSPMFLQALEGRAIEFGHQIGVKYGEGFTVDRIVGVKDLSHLL